MQTQETTRTDHYVALDETYGAKNYKPLNVVVERAEGVWVYDVDGKRYMDCLAAYSAVNQGHCHPRIKQAMIDQIDAVTLTSRAFRNDQMGPFLKQLAELTGYDMALLMNTGAEAVETAIKAARKWGYQVKGVPAGQAEIIVCEGNFHGRTTTIVGFSSEAQYRQDFGPFTPGFIEVPYGDAQALAAAVTQHTVGFLVEPIQGEAGVVVPPAGYLTEAANICEANDVLLITDEIQSGLGRTGRLFAYQHESVRPDMVIIGKALSGGFYPVSAVLADQPILGLFQPGDHGSTYGGNPLGAAVARAALAVLIDDNLLDRSAVLGAYLIGCLRGINSPLIKEVRGKGLWVGLELTEPARPYCEALIERGILCKETRKNVIRIAPPLVIMQDEVDWLVEQFAAVLECNQE